MRIGAGGHCGGMHIDGAYPAGAERCYCYSSAERKVGVSHDAREYYNVIYMGALRWGELWCGSAVFIDLLGLTLSDHLSLTMRCDSRFLFAG
jgi:hypothetical protein